MVCDTRSTVRPSDQFVQPPELLRILALGDSHTAAVGVEPDETWPKVLQAELNKRKGSVTFRVYNGGVTGFNMHQYLLRLIDQGPVLHPSYVVIGLSYATDLYDLLPPDRGGWIYGDARWSRDYFDFNSDGALELRRYEPTAASTTPRPADDAAQNVRRVLDHLAIFRYLRRSSMALWIGSHVTVGGRSLWPNMEIIVEKEVPAEHRYQWQMFEALLLRINDEAEHQGAKLILVGIPYLPQVYDEIWNVTFGGDSRFARTAAIERVQDLCERNQIRYVDTLDAFRTRVHERGRYSPSRSRVGQGGDLDRASAVSSQASALSMNR